jgi:hypothetical protein
VTIFVVFQASDPAAVGEVLVREFPNNRSFRPDKAEQTELFEDFMERPPTEQAV